LKFFAVVYILLHGPLISFSQGIIFYLHGKIVEDQGIPAIDTLQGYGTYQYEDILDAFRQKKFTVISEVRERATNPFDYARKLAQRIDSCIKKGVAPDQITVIGASKGAVIAMICSSYLGNKDVNYVFLAGCNKELLEGFSDIKFQGNILSIYEKSDDIGRSCSGFKNRPLQIIPHYKEIELHTGLKHGFLYRPLPEWVMPAIKWAANDYK
jgi:hypothetical protein